MESTQVRGERLVTEMSKLVMDCLHGHSEGLTSTEVSRYTALDAVKLSRQNGYIAWTILQQLLVKGRIRKSGRKYLPNCL